jgi:hypothetical protein
MVSILNGSVRALTSKVYRDQSLTDNAVIVLIAAEILVAAINIVVDLYAGVD